jgi:hypothetical protein
LFINFSPVADGEDPENPRFTIPFVNDAKSSDFEAPESSGVGWPGSDQDNFLISREKIA